MVNLIAAFDPASKTGWALIGVSDSRVTVLDSGSFRWDGKGLSSTLRGIVVDAECLVIEDCFERKSRRHAPATNRAHFAAAQKRIGHIMGYATCLLGDGLRTWTPMPSAWRSVLRGAGVPLAFAPREAAKAGALAVARSLGRECKGVRGGDDNDQADAVCIGLAGAVYLAGASLSNGRGG